MSRGRFPFRMLVGLLVLAAGCSGDKIYNQYSLAGAVYGRVLPADARTEVSAWQATKIKSTTLDTQGYFTLMDLAPGYYTIKIEAPSGARRELENVEVDLSRSSPLGTIMLNNLAPPLAGYGPTDTADVAVSDRIFLLSDKRLDLGSLSTGITITPPVHGEWTQGSINTGNQNYSLYQYYLSGGPLNLSTSYTVSVGPEVKIYQGDAWGGSFSYSFKTEPFRLVSTNGYQDTAAVAPGYRGSIVELVYNSSIDPRSLSGSVSATPSAGVRVTLSTYESRRIVISLTDGVKAGMSYRVVIGTGLADVSGAHPTSANTVTFTTDQLRLTGVEFGSYVDSAAVSPGYSGTIATLSYNDDIDPGTLAAAVTVDPPSGISVMSGSSYDPSDRKRLAIVSSGQMKTATHYRIVIGTELADVFGAHKAAPDTLTFSTDAFRLAQRLLARGTTVPPDLHGLLFADTYNAPIDFGSIRPSITVSPPVDFEISTDSHDPNRFSFRIAGALRPSTNYQVAIGPNLATLDGTLMGSEQKIAFSTEALQVTDVRFSNSNYSTQTELDPGHTFYAQIYLNTKVDPDSFTQAASFDPPIPGVWIWKNDYDGNHMEFFPTAQVNLIPEQHYTFTLDGSKPLVDDISLGADLTRTFDVAPVSIESISPSNASRNVGRYSTIEVTFNTEMDQASTQAAFSLETYSGTPVAGSFETSYSGDSFFRFRPSAQLAANETYRIRITTGATSLLGPHLKTEWSSIFTTASSTY